MAVKKHKKNQKIARQTVLLLTVIYAVMMIHTVYEAENFPTIRNLFSSDWSDSVESWLKQNLGFHDVLFQLKSRTDLMIGEKVIQGIYITDERLIEKQSSDEALNISLVNDFYQIYGLPTYLILVPSASEIYEESLPANAISVNQKNMIKAAYADTETGIRCVDAYHILMSLKDSYIYYRTDSHWTSCGAYYVYQSAIQKMGFTPVPYQRYVISHLSTDFKGDLYQRTLYDNIRPDLLDCYTYENGSQIQLVKAYYQNHTDENRTALYDISALETDHMYQFYTGKPCEKMIIRTDLHNDKKLLLYKDDFADCMIPFLAQHYSEICVINLEQTGTHFQEITDPSEYTQVMFLCSVKNWQEIF